MRRTPSCGGISVTDCFLLWGFSVICFVFEISESDTESKKCDTHLSIGKPVVSITFKIPLFSGHVLGVK